MKWIPVSERYPPVGESVLITGAGNIGHARRINFEWVIVASNDKASDRSVTHWMPLPEPPKEQE
jgi:hypothetical protein